MATTTAFGPLSIPAPDDTMEMSSPANRNLDDDIDIDFEDYQGGVHLVDDEHMLEDADPTRPTTATDDMMEDDFLPGEQSHIEEEIMRDDVPEVEEVQQHEDEELIDYGEDDFLEPLGEDTTLPAVEEHAETQEISFAPADENLSAEVEGAPVEASGSSLPDEARAETARVEEPAEVTEELQSIELAPDVRTQPEESTALVDRHKTQEVSENTADGSLTDPSGPGDNTLTFPPPLDTAVSTSTDSPGTPTDTGLHPMTVRYRDFFLPLFKSKRQPEGLLKDDNLANLSLAELITNCRQRLASKIGEEISADQEFVLGFEHLGLMLVEDCRAAFESSLNDVLEVYLQLHQNDSAQDVPPLALNLSLQLKFQSSFAILKQAAAGGQGISSFHFLHSTADAGEDFYQEEFDDAEDSGPQEEDDVENVFEGQDIGDTTFEENEEEAQLDFEGRHQDNDEEAGERGEEGHEEQYQEGEYVEHFGEEDFYIPEQSEAAAQLDELGAGESYAEEAQANELEDSKVNTGASNAVENTAVSTTSSTTVQGDSANISAGEYDGELIDWGEDSLTNIDSEPDADAQHDFSTFLTEYEEDEARDGLPEGAAVAPQSHGLDGNVKLGQAADDIVDSEDILQDLANQEHRGAIQAGGQAYEGQYGPGGDEEEEHDFDQADTDEQRDKYQPGEEDEQFHTAHDLLNADSHEHGPEDDVYGEDGDALDDTVGTVIHHDTTNYQEHDDQEDFGDEIGFDEDDENPQQNGATVATSGSPSGKRSFDDLDDFGDDDREAKKARAS